MSTVPDGTAGPGVDGDVANGWGPVADAFSAAFADGRELGAGVAVYVDGQAVVDLWAGTADARTGRPWDRDTIVTVMSTTKGAASIVVHLLAERGLLDLDAPVAGYWPEFAAAGKERLTVSQVLSHQAGLEYVDVDLTFDEVCARKPVLRALEAQRPHYMPGSKSGYHALTWGFLVEELVLRITGRTLGEVFADEIAEPLGLRSWIGLPEELEQHVGHLEASGSAATGLAAKVLMAVALRKAGRAITFGSALPMQLITGGPNDVNSRRFREVGFAAAGMVTDARSLARLYASTVSEVDGRRLLSAEAVERARALQTTHLPDPKLLGKTLPRRDFSLGFTSDEQMLGPTAFGFFGAGGSLGFADVGHGVGFGYVMNKMDGPRPSFRGMRLARVVRECLERR